MYLNVRSIAETYKDGRNRTFKAVLGLLSVFTVIGALFPRSSELLALIPANAVRLHLWTLATAGFFETTPIMVCEWNLGLLNALEIDSPVD